MKKVKGQALRIARWSDSLYDVSIVLMHGEWVRALAWMNETFTDITEDNVGTGTGAKAVWIEREKGVALVLWLPTWFNVEDGVSLSNLAHECFHAACMVLSARGLTLSDASDEAYAYYVGWMFRECYRRMAK